MNSVNARREKRLHSLLSKVERAGNALPHPALLFLYLSAAGVLLSSLIARLGVTAVHPVKQDIIQAHDLFSIAGLHLILADMVKNYVGFAPLGTVLVAMLGFSIAEKSGLLATLLQLFVRKAPRALLIPVVLLAGILSHTAGDIGYVLLIPLAALCFYTAGLHPMAGLAVCFAGVSGGFAANFLVSALDPLLAGLSQESARILDPSYVVNPLVNWYFLAASSALILLVGTLVAEKITLPYLGRYEGERQDMAVPRDTLHADERRGLLAAGVTTVLFLLLLLVGLVPASGFLRDPADPDVLHSAAMKGLIALIFLFGAANGIAYGFGARVFKSSADIVEAMQDGMKSMAPYLVLVFFAAQFIAIFNASNIGLILAIHGAELLKSWGLSATPLMLGFILFTCILDLFIGSASAKWALMAPVFVPMFMLLGISPELSQLNYRIADSVVNIISPLMPYFPLILAFALKYDPKARVGTIIALMLPYSIAFLLSWTIMLFVWIGLDLPLGPGARLDYLVPTRSAPQVPAPAMPETTIPPSPGLDR